MNKPLLTAGLALGLGLGAYGVSRADTPRMERLVTVQGHGKASGVPDQARLTIAVSEEGPKVDAVSQEVRRKMDAVMKTLKSQGLAEKDIQTQFYRVTPKTKWQNNRATRDGYVVSNQVEAVIHDLKKTGTVLAAVLDAGANDVNGPQFEFENPGELEHKALGLALADAKAKAGLLAQAAGASLGEVVTIQESGIVRPGPRPYIAMKMARAEMAAAPEEPIAAGQETVEANLTAAFALK